MTAKESAAGLFRKFFGGPSGAEVVDSQILAPRGNQVTVVARPDQVVNLVDQQGNPVFPPNLQRSILQQLGSGGLPGTLNLWREIINEAEAGEDPYRLGSLAPAVIAHLESTITGQPSRLERAARDHQDKLEAIHRANQPNLRPRRGRSASFDLGRKFQRTRRRNQRNRGLLKKAQGRRRRR